MNDHKALYRYLPFIILIYFFIHFSNDLYLFISTELIVAKVIQYFLITGLIYYAGYIIFSDKRRYILIFVSLLFFYLFFGSFIDTLKLMGLYDLQLMSIRVQFIFFFGVTVLAIVLLCRVSSNVVRHFLFFWTLYIGILLAYDIISFLIVQKNEKRYFSNNEKINLIRSVAKPSVFYLVFDMYPSDSSLMKYMGHDNRAISSFLKEQGFFVAGNSKALYDATYYSLASTFSLLELGYLKDKSVAVHKKPLIALKNIERSKVPLLFSKSGYIVRNYSVFNLLNEKSPLQWNLGEHTNDALTASTFFNRINVGFDPDFFENTRGVDFSWLKKSWSSKARQDLFFLRGELNKLLNDSKTINQPSFNYFHYPMPHPPVLFDSSGRETKFKDMFSHGGLIKSKENFISYLKFTNAEIKNIVTSIFQIFGSNVVIIIQGDHGYREFPDKFPSELRYAIFNAVYLPNRKYEGFNDSITPIETIKEVLTSQFDYPVD